ncbi:MAG: hypothetical protein C0176_08475 [Mesoaciditoga sp.]|nr:MAG: hypothetical protein C0176_08475 [Mesoaciditoga sp.]
MKNNVSSVVYGGIFIAVGLVLSIVIHSLGGQQFGTIFGPLNFVGLITGLYSTNFKFRIFDLKKCFKIQG